MENLYFFDLVLQDDNKFRKMYEQEKIPNFAKMVSKLTLLKTLYPAFAADGIIPCYDLENKGINIKYKAMKAFKFRRTYRLSMAFLYLI